MLATSNDDTIARGIMDDLVFNGYLLTGNGELTDKARGLNNFSSFVIGSTYASYKAMIYDLIIRTVPLENLIRTTFSADYNYVAGSPTAGYPSKRTSDCVVGATSTVYNFCEPHGINGGNPKFSSALTHNSLNCVPNTQDPNYMNDFLGPDCTPFTLDDGLKPLPGSPLCGAGEGGTDIGAYSCSGGQQTGDTFPPSVPTGLSSSNITQTSVTISWNASTDASGISGYRVYRNSSFLTTVTGTSYANTGLVANTIYSYTISAIDASTNANVSNQSSPLSVTTLAATQTSTKFKTGDQIQVTNGPVNIRSTPSTSGTLLGIQATGNLGTIVSNVQNGVLADGHYWWNVNYDNGVDGWTAEEYLSVYTPVNSSNCSQTNIRCVDDTPGPTQEYSTIQACANVVNPGDTCLVSTGRYEEFIQLDRGGVAGNPVTFKSNGDASLQGFRLKQPYITIDGFDITKYPVGLLMGQISIEEQANYSTIINNNIHDGIQLLSNDFSFNAVAKTITNPTGGFISAGFVPGTLIYVASNINWEILNANKTYTVASVTDTTLTLTASPITEGPVLAVIYATRGGRTGVNGIYFDLTSTHGAASHVVIKNNRFFNLSGVSMIIKGSFNLIEGNVFERTNGWGIIELVGHDNILRYNLAKNSPRYSGMETPIRCETGQSPGKGCAPDQSSGGHWDFVANTLQAYGSPSIAGNDNLFEYNFFDNLDNEIFKFNEYSLDNSAANSLTDTVIRNNVFSRIEFQGQFHAPDTVLEHNTFYKSAYETDGHVFPIANSVGGNADGSIVRSNAFIENSSLNSRNGWYDIVSSVIYGTPVMPTPNWNFVAGPASQGFPAKADFVGKESTSGTLNGGDPRFQNINNPIGPDGIPFTSDDGLIPLDGSPLCSGGENGGYIGAYQCSGPVTPPTYTTGDFNHDGLVNSIDLSLLTSYWNQNNATYDLNNDNIINSLDYDIMVQNWSV
ncbi:MAG: dockerin type I domain-containing protein [Candidatus Paceibacterota bacterium]|jgi:chitodextrinase